MVTFTASCFSSSVKGVGLIFKVSPLLESCGPGAGSDAGFAEPDDCPSDVLAELDAPLSPLEEVRAPHPARLAVASVTAKKTKTGHRMRTRFMHVPPWRCGGFEDLGPSTSLPLTRPRETCDADVR